MTEELFDIIVKNKIKEDIMQPIRLENIEIPMTKELQDFFIYRYQGKTTKLVDDFLIYLNTQKEAYEINKALKEIKRGETNNIGKLFDEL